MAELTFTINEAPVPQPRVKARRLGNAANAPIQIYTPQNARVKAYKASCAKSFKDAAQAKEDFDLPPDANVELLMTFVINRPQSMCGPKFNDDEIWHSKKPDIDNLAKAVMDGLNGVAWSDDSKVIKLQCEKKYCGVELGGSSGRKRMSKGPEVRVTVRYLP